MFAKPSLYPNPTHFLIKVYLFGRLYRVSSKIPISFGFVLDSSHVVLMLSPCCSPFGNKVGTILITFAMSMASVEAPKRLRRVCSDGGLKGIASKLAEGRANGSIEWEDVVVVMAMAAVVGNAGRLVAVSAARWPSVGTRRVRSMSDSVQSMWASQCVSVSREEATRSDVCGMGVKAVGRVSLKEMTFPELESWVESHGHKASRAGVLWRHMYGSGKWVESAEVIPRLSKEFVALLEERAEFAPSLQLRDVYKAKDGTRKLVFFVEEYEASVETVVIPGPRGRVTVCVSSQIGCAMNCQFCFTAKMGLRGNLSTGQIVEQLVVASRMCGEELGQVTNVVFMGMGEPLHNLDSVIRAAEIMVSDTGLHLSPRKVTISTSGLVPQIRTFCRTSKCALAVSLNATTDEVRDRIMPINRKYNIRTLLDCLREELITFRPGESVFFEYVMLKNINDTEKDAARLVELVKDIPCKINLITFNSHPGSAFEPTPLHEVLKFRDRVADAGFVVHIRNSRGDDEKMACGQLGTVLPRPPRRRKQDIQEPA